MNWKDLQKKRNKAISKADLKFTNWCNLYHKRFKLITALFVLLLLFVALSGVTGYLIRPVKVEEVIVTKEVIKEVCPVLQSANYTIVTGDTMEEKLIILEGK